MLSRSFTISVISFLVGITLIIGFLFYGVRAQTTFSSFEVVIEKPNPCYEVERIKENEVFLKKKDNCVAPQVIVSEKIRLKKWYDVLKVYVDGTLWKEISLKEVSPEKALKVIEEAKKRTKDLGNFSNIHEKEGKELAEKVYNIIQGPEHQKLVKQYQDNLTSKEGISLKDIYKDYVEKKREEKSKVLVLDPDERLYIFVSSSIPRETIRNYVTFISSHIEGNVVFVLRGGIGGLKKLSPTVAWIYDVIKKDKFCEGINCEVYGVEFVIDPFLFKRYGVERVPAVVYVKGREITKFEGSEGLEDKWETKVWGKTYGDMGLAYHLKVIGEEFKIEKIKRFVDKLNM
jgi:type-F conjugative transfer system pilin assembly protein TrbC